jgi:hypothetical protein
MVCVKIYNRYMSVEKSSTESTSSRSSEQLAIEIFTDFFVFHLLHLQLWFAGPV